MIVKTNRWQCKYGFWKTVYFYCLQNYNDLESYTAIMMKIQIINILILTATLSSLSMAQKAPLDHSVYSSWNSISSKALSPEGAFASWTESPGRGDGTLYVVQLEGKKTKSYARGHNPVFSEDEIFMVIKVAQPYDTLKKLKLLKINEKDLPKDSLFVISLVNDSIIRMSGVENHSLAREGSLLVVKVLQHTKSETITDSLPDAKEREKNKKKKAQFQLLVTRPFQTPLDTFLNVESHAISANGRSLAFTSLFPEKDSAALFAGRFGETEIKEIHRIPGKIFRPVWNEQGNLLAFLCSADSSLKKNIRLYLYDAIANKVILAADSAGMGAGRADRKSVV